MEPVEAIALVWDGAVGDAEGLQPSGAAHEPGQLVRFQIQGELLDPVTDRKLNPRVNASLYPVAGTIKAEREPLHLIWGVSPNIPVNERDEAVQLAARVQGFMEIDIQDVGAAPEPTSRQAAEPDDIFGGQEGEDAVHQMVGKLVDVIRSSTISES